jgi:predicted small metal-binding protein
MIVMKTLACGELVPSCAQTFQAATEEELLVQAGRHAQDAHGLTVTPELVEQVRAHIRDDGDDDRGAGQPA